jgi:death-on-curing protein
VAEVIAIHHHQIEEYGGAHGLRDQGALEAAVCRPQMGYTTTSAKKRPR